MMAELSELGAYKDRLRRCQLCLYTYVGEEPEFFARCPIHLKVSWTVVNRVVVHGLAMFNEIDNLSWVQRFDPPHSLLPGDTITGDFSKLYSLDYAPGTLIKKLIPERKSYSCVTKWPSIVEEPLLKSVNRLRRDT